MIRLVISVLVLGVVVFFSACGPKQFSKGEYDDMSAERHLDDKFNETDMREIADTMIKSLTESALIQNNKKRPVVLVTLIKNRSQEHIDMKSMTDKIKVALIKSGKFRFTEKETREEMAGEVDYQSGSGYVDPSTARQKGKQIGAEYFLTGEITDRVQEVGDEKFVYYKCTLNLVNIQSGILDWSDERELRKKYKKRHT